MSIIVCLLCSLYKSFKKKTECQSERADCFSTDFLCELGSIYRLFEFDSECHWVMAVDVEFRFLRLFQNHLSKVNVTLGTE